MGVITTCCTRESIIHNSQISLYSKSEDDFMNNENKIMEISLNKEIDNPFEFITSGKYYSLILEKKNKNEISYQITKNKKIQEIILLMYDLLKWIKDINKLTRKKNGRNGGVEVRQNLEEKKETSMKEYIEDIMSKINKLNVEQKKGILDIISDNLVNKNCENNIVEFNINKLPLNQLKQLDLYINKCINNNIIINKDKNEIIENNDEITDELSNPSCDSSDSESYESLDFD